MNEREQQWEENQKKKEYLNGYQNSKKQEKRILNQIQQLRMDEMFPSWQYDDMPHGTDMSDLSDYAVKMDELMSELKQERLEAITQYTNIYRQIRKMEDERERSILTYRYLNTEEWEDICGLIGLKWSRMHEIHAEALKNFEIG